VYGTVAKFKRAVKNGLLTKVGDLFVEDQVMQVFPWAGQGGHRYGAACGAVSAG
jgi:hypothetical protein